MEVVEVFICPHCEEAFETPGGQVNECSRCGSTAIVEDGERGRCESCHIFTAKVAEYSCPECEQGLDDDAQVVDRWVAPDGTYHESPEEVEQWVEDAPVRAEEAAMAERRMEETRQRWEAERLARRADLEAHLKAYGRPIAYYACDPGRMQWDSHTCSVTQAEMLELTCRPDIIDALRLAELVQDDYLRDENPRQAWVLPSIKDLDERADWDYVPGELARIRRQESFQFDVPVLKRLIKRNIELGGGNTPKV